MRAKRDIIAAVRLTRVEARNLRRLARLMGCTQSEAIRTLVERHHAKMRDPRE